jgi:bifunctional non-homologous end joining protein LigD
MVKAPRGSVRERSLDASDESVRSRAIVGSRQHQDSPGLFDEPFPDRIEACVPTLVSAPPSGDRWWHEIKWDGYRLVSYVRDGRVCLRTRRGLDWTERFPVIAAAARELPVRSAILDGEAVVLDEQGRSSFSALQAALGSRHGPGHRAAREAVLYVFDLLHLDGRDLRREPLEARRAALVELLSTAPQTGTVRLSEHVEGQGEAMFRHACRMRLEGIVSKRRDRPYVSGLSKDWLKIKCLLREAFVIAGFIVSVGARGRLGALCWPGWRATSSSMRAVSGPASPRRARVTYFSSSRHSGSRRRRSPCRARS